MNKITFVKPSNTTSISVTNTKCVLQCPYCNSHYLKNMKGFDIEYLKNYKSVLVSGGIREDGVLPFEEYYDQLKLLKKNNIKINLHSGIIRDEKRLLKVKDVVDEISFDFIIDEQTIDYIFNGFYNSDDYKNTLNIFLKNDVRVTPHILTGVFKGKIIGEYKSLEYLHNKKIKNIVLLFLIPNKNTEYKDLEPPHIDHCQKLIDYAVSKFENVTIGCMRPGGLYRKKLDKIALEAGVKKIVMPSREVEKYALENGYKVDYKYECCVF